MQPTEPSRTAKMAALARGTHREIHRPPWVFDDPYAIPLIGPGWDELDAAISQVFREDVKDAAIAFVVARSRYTEEHLEAGEFTQYVILGAGLDSFAWRRPDALNRLTVYEVDHPATQAWKQQRAEVVALPHSERHVFVPIDFETQTLPDGLQAASFDWEAPTLFTWLGVVPYLTADAITATLETIVTAGPGSHVVLTYATAGPPTDDTSRRFIDLLSGLAAQSGEPILTFWSPDEAEQVMTSCKLDVVDHPDAATLVTRYFASREDGLRPQTVERLLTAAVGAP
jgi:methyltransferase (TIGR00027 family)